VVVAYYFEVLFQHLSGRMTKESLVNLNSGSSVFRQNSNLEHPEQQYHLNISYHIGNSSANKW
jgi:hypothetical protein